ncbi:MAG: hypothetical protein HZB53_09990 [Chloroflexi bacterium]|nr:hypothetical protein [Chloroflexota bacterium]
MKRAVLVLAFWVVAALFPFGWPTVFSTGYARAFNSVFDYEIAHIVMHALIFAGLAVLLARVLGGGASPRQLLLIAVAVTLVALAQEAAQLSYKGHGWTAAETFDIATDWAGGLAGIAATRLTGWLRDRRRAVL